MKTLFLVLVLSVIAIACLLLLFVKREQNAIRRIGDTFLTLLRKFDSWQMMR